MENQSLFTKRSFMFLLFGIALFSGSIVISFLINFIVPKPYMDEIFHVDQIQRYCRGRFGEWNDKITTPPALYFASYGFWKFVDSLANFTSIKSLIPFSYDCDSVAGLRFLNLVFLLAVYFVICDILRLRWNSTKSVNVSPIILCSTALNVCVFPVLYFTAFLYYTDILSTLTVMLAYLFQLRRWRIASAVVGACSCAVRQTNIIWVAFCCYLTLVEVVIGHLRLLDQKRRIGLRKREREDNNDQGTSFRDIIYEDDAIAFAQRIKIFLQSSKRTEIASLFLNCVFAVWSYVIVGIGFIAFIIWNGGVVLGDRTAHQACLHLVQFCYWALFTCIFGFAVVTNVRNISSVFRIIVRRPTTSLFLLIMTLVTIYGFTCDHPYLLADNRHYTFYIWRRWFMRHVALKYVLAPIYVCCFIVIYSLSANVNALWRVGFLCSAFLVTVPNRLLEFRYFILPFYFWRLHVMPLSKQRLGLEFLLFFVINILTFWLFLCKPFKWSNSDDWQRFMW